MLKTVFTIILIGIIATLIMDIGGALLRTTKITAGAPPELTGKWIHSVFKGNMFVQDIRTSPGEPVALGRFLAYHYIIGILLAALFCSAVLLLKIQPVAWWLPLLYGIGTTIIPALLMFPGMGFGILGLQGPAEYLLLRTALLNHLFYGLGLMLAVKWLLK
jgi:hypothetical protein